MPSYVKDTGDFLHIISKLDNLPLDTILVTLDVTSLYTNVPLEQAKIAVAKVLSENRPGTQQPSNQSLLRLLHLVFTKNIFTFSDGQKLTFYRQTNGVSMGSKCAPSVACTFMGEFERKHVYTYEKQPRLWLRFIDDVFCLWTHGLTELNKFTEYLNSRETRVKFTEHHSTTHIEFLDLTVRLVGTRLETELYVKPTSSLSYLRRDSCHPKHVFSSLAYGEFIRVRRNCSNLETFDTHSETILNAFLKRGYERELLDKARAEARSKSRSDLLSTYETTTVPTGSNIQEPRSDTSTTWRDHHCVLTYHPANRAIKHVITQNWDLLGTSEATRELYESKIVFGYRRNPRLRDLLVRSSIPLTENNYGHTGKRSHECTAENCIYCSSLDTTGRIISHSVKKSFMSKKNVTCKSHNVVYCLQCQTCGKQYVGQTKRTIHERLREHFRNVRNGTLDDPIGRHFNSDAHNGEITQIKVYILAFITPPSNSSDALRMRLRVENSWIYRLRTSLPLGLNAMD